MKVRSRLFDQLIVRSWWTILFILIALFVYDQAILQRNREQQSLIAKQEELSRTLLEAQLSRENLKQQITSQEDPEWIALVLMRELGLVPEGQRKVYFR